jgi:hypothetical protein
MNGVCTASRSTLDTRRGILSVTKKGRRNRGPRVHLPFFALRPRLVSSERLRSLASRGGGIPSGKLATCSVPSRRCVSVIRNRSRSMVDRSDAGGSGSLALANWPVNGRPNSNQVEAGSCRYGSRRIHCIFIIP